MRQLYSCLFYLLIPFILLRLLLRARKAPAYARRWGERFGFYRQPRPEPVIWLHAVSVGEAEAAFPLLRRLKEHYPEQALLVTTTTPTGSARVRSVLGESVLHVYLPYDLPACVGRFLRHFRPRLAIIMETEIWPNLFHQCGRNGIPLAIVNARLSERSARGYGRLHSLTAATLAQVRWIGAQSGADAERFVALGAEQERVRITGNIKFDQPAEGVNAGQDLRARLFPGRPVWIAASTHSGEEEAILAVHSALRQSLPALLLILVPRHPERFGAVAALCAKQGLAVVRRSQQRACSAGDAVFLLDTMGELKQFYGSADAAFVGGSLVATGGHNVLEPAALGLPVLFGPHMFNFREIAESLLAAGGCIQVQTPAAMAGPLRQWLEDPESRHRYGSNARRFVENNRGALEAVLALLEPLLQGGTA